MKIVTVILARFAEFIPHWLSHLGLLNLVDIRESCVSQRLLCLAYQGTEALEPNLPIFPQTGIHMEIHSAPWAFIEETDLMQRSTRWTRNHALDVSGRASESAGFCFNVEAPEFVPGRPLLAAQPEFIQDLHLEWDQFAFAWEQEERSHKGYDVFCQPS